MEDRCVCCGEIIPEGSGMVCKICEERILHEEKSEKPPEKERQIRAVPNSSFFCSTKEHFLVILSAQKKSERRYYEV